MFFDNLKAICDEKNLKVTPLVLECGGTKGILGGWKKGASPNSDIVVKLADRLNVSIDLLLRTPDNAKKFMKKLDRPNPTPDEEDLLNKYRGVGESSKALIRERATALFELENLKKSATENPPLAEKAENFEEEDEPLYLDLFDMPVSAGYGSYVDFPGRESKQVPRTHLTESADYMVRVSGDSMEPRFSDGDIVLVQSTPTVEIGEIGIFILNGQAFIKERGVHELISLNEKYPNIPICEDDRIDCQGKVLEILDVKKGA